MDFPVVAPSSATKKSCELTAHTFHHPPRALDMTGLRLFALNDHADIPQGRGFNQLECMGQARSSRFLCDSTEACRDQGKKMVKLERSHPACLPFGPRLALFSLFVCGVQSQEDHAAVR